MKSTVPVGFDFYVMYLLFHVCSCVALVNIYGVPHRNSSNKEMGDKVVPRMSLCLLNNMYHGFSVDSLTYFLPSYQVLQKHKAVLV